MDQATRARALQALANLNRAFDELQAAVRDVRFLTGNDDKVLESLEEMQLAVLAEACRGITAILS